MPEELKVSENYAANITRYQLFTALLAGGGFVLYPRIKVSAGRIPESSKRDTYLVRLAAEELEEEGFYLRQRQSAHHPISSPIISVYVDFLFRQELTRNHLVDKLPAGFLRNVDHKGTEVDLWLQRKYHKGLGGGWMLGLVDRPNENTDFASNYYRSRAGDRPYVEAIMPQRVWNLELDSRDNIKKALIRESETRFRLWETDKVTEIIVDADRKIQNTNPTNNDLGYVPMQLFVANERDIDIPHCPYGISAIEAISDIDLQILQATSLLQNIQTKTQFPFLWISVNKTSDQTLGGDFILAIDTDNVEWKAPPGEIMEVGMKYIDWLKESAKKMAGVHSAARDSVESHSGLALDYENQPIYATVQRWATNLKTWETRLWEMTLDQVSSSPVPVDIDLAPIYPDDFSSRPVDKDIKIAKEMGDVFGGYGSAPALVQKAVDYIITRAAQRHVGTAPFTKIKTEYEESVKKNTSEIDAALKEKLDLYFAVAEQMVKMKVPNTVVSEIVKQAAALLNIEDAAVKKDIEEATYRWYTEVQTEMQTTGEVPEDASSPRKSS